MAVTSRYRGDSQIQIATSANQTRMHLRTVNDDSAPADRAFEVLAGQAITFYYRWINVFFGVAPNKVTIEVRDDNTSTVIRTYQTLGPEPAIGAAFTFWGTHDGTQTGTPQGGTVRLYLRAVKDNGSVTDNYNLDSDGAVTVSPAGSSTVIHSGCLRVNALVDDLTASAYAARSLHANGEPFVLTAAHTPKYGGAGSKTVRLDAIDAAGSQTVAGASAEFDTGAAYAQSVLVTGAFTGGLAAYGARLVPVSNAGFVPSSGPIPWTKFVANGPNVVQDGNGVRRDSFYNVDPSLKVDLHTQKGSALVKDPITAPDLYEHFAAVILGDTMHTWVHVTNARDEDVSTSGSAITVTVADPEGAAALTYTTDAGADGWTPRRGILPAAPAGIWNYSTSVTRNGITKVIAQSITYITPLTSNLEVLVLGPVFAKPGQTIRVWVRCEIDDLPAPPEDQPTLRLFDEVLNVVIASIPLLSAATGTAAINGPRYYADITLPTTPGRYVLWTRAQLNGNGIRRSQVLRVAADGFDPIGLFAGPA